MSGEGIFPRIGSDEAGKGDYFGYLVAAAVWLGSPEDEEALLALGVRDSKKISDGKVRTLAAQIRGLAPHEIVRISPRRYNELYEKMNNLNRLLAWAHARAIKSLLDRRPCSAVVADQFGDERYLRQALGGGWGGRLIQRPGAEEDTAVAAASILARDAFLQGMDRLAQKVGRPLPKGATHVIEPAKEMVDRFGEGVLRETAKLHFKSTQKILGPPA